MKSYHTNLDNGAGIENTPKIKRHYVAYNRKHFFSLFHIETLHFHKIFFFQMQVLVASRFWWWQAPNWKKLSARLLHLMLLLQYHDSWQHIHCVPHGLPSFYFICHARSKTNLNLNIFKSMPLDKPFSPCFNHHI